MSIPIHAESFRFASTLASVEHDLVGRLALASLPIPAELAHIEGSAGDAPVVDVRAYAGGPIAHARFATIVGGSGLEIASVLCLGRADLALPIFTADLIAVGRDRALLAIDLCPATSSDAATRQLTALARRRRRWSDLPSAGALPPWMEPFASPHRVFVRLDRRRRDAAALVLRDFTDELVRLAARAVVQPEHAGTAHATMREYVAAQRGADGSFGVLARAFGRELATRYMSEVLFPDLR